MARCKPVDELARELDLDPATIVKLASNENPLGASPKALAAWLKERRSDREIQYRPALWPTPAGHRKPVQTICRPGSRREDFPFAAKDPLRVIPASIVGGALTGALSMYFGCVLAAPHGGLRRFLTTWIFE